jgi:hypothetical protein
MKRIFYTTSGANPIKEIFLSLKCLKNRNQFFFGALPQIDHAIQQFIEVMEKYRTI